MAKPRVATAVKIASNALLKSGHSMRSIARDLNVSHTNVSNWSKDKRYQILAPDEVDQIRKSLAGNSYKIAHRIQAGMTDAKIEAATLSQLAVSQAILIEKGNLLSGMATSNLAFGSVLQNIESDRQKLANSIAEIEGTPDQPTNQ